MKRVNARTHSSSQPVDRRALAEIDDLIDNGAFEAASVLAWDVQRATPGDPAIWLLLTRIDFLRERYAAAMYAARMATRLDPSSTDAWVWLARTGATRARWRTEALDAALQATALGPADPRTWTVLAELHLQLDAQYEAAIAAERAVRVGPTDVAAHRVLGDIALAAGEWPHAASAFRRTLDLDPHDEQGQAGLAQALRGQGIDPADELARYGALPGRRSRLTGGVRRLAQHNLDLSDPGPWRARPRGLLLALGGFLVLGTLVGLLLPGLGMVRGLVGATAIALMWLAIWPLRTREPVPAGAPAGASARGDRQVDVPTGQSRAIRSAPNESAAEPAIAKAAAPPAEAQRQKTSKTTDQPATTEQPAPAAKAVTPKQQVRADSAQPAAEPTRRRAARARADRTRVGRMTSAGGRRTGEPDRPTAGGGAGASSDTDASSDERAVGEPTSASAPDVTSTAQPESPAADASGLPSRPGELAALSATKLAEFDLEAARAAAERLAQVAPESLEAYRALAAVSLAEQDYVQAEAHYTKVLEIEPLDQEAHERLAMAKKGRRREQQQQQPHKPLKRRRGKQ